MAWFKVDDNFFSHPNINEISLEAIGLWTLAGSWNANYFEVFSRKKSENSEKNPEKNPGKSSEKFRQDFVSLSTLRMLRGRKKLAKELVSAGLWVEVDGGYMIIPGREEERSRREKGAARERKRRSRAAAKNVTNVTRDITVTGA